jgi:glycyl-tRNA synthetase
MQGETGEPPVVPHVIEPSFGVDRTVLAVLASAYREDEMNGEVRSYLAFKKEVAPVKAAVFPLLKNKPELVGKARTVYSMLKKEVPQIMWDDNGNIGKRYRRQDEIGTPYCITVDFDSLEDDTVTVRDRDTGEQKRVPISTLADMIR